MANIKIVGDACVITSGLKLEEIKLVNDTYPKYLTLFEEEDGKKNPVFKLAVATGKGSISEFGISFGRTTNDGEGYAQLTVSVPEGAGDVKERVAKAYGTAMMHLNIIEEELPDVIEAIRAEHAKVLDSIELI